MENQNKSDINEFSVSVTIKDLVESGAHFGHQKSRRNPKMKRYIFGLREGIYIIDLAKTLFLLRKACKAIQDVVGAHQSVLFVGTKKQAKTVIKESAIACGEKYVSERWRGGTLTNLVTIRNSIKTLDRIEKKLGNPSHGLTKKEVLDLEKKRAKLDRDLSGVREMRKVPGLVIVVDPNQEHLAVAEANKLNIPVMAILDTNCDPDPIKYPIPCNDDALKSIRIIIRSIAESIIHKKRSMHKGIATSDVDEEEARIEAEREKEEERKRRARNLASKLGVSDEEAENK